MTDATWLLRRTPTHEHRPEATLRHWAEVSEAFGRALAATHVPRDLPTTEAPGGRTGEELTLATYQRGRVTLYPEALEWAAGVAAGAGLSEFTLPVLRDCAVLHELAHHRLHGAQARRLRVALGHAVLRIGSWRWWGYVAGAEEVVAHSYAQAVLGLARSPVALTRALAESLSAVPATQPSWSRRWDS
ncbi:hypothetical protein JOF53_008363 [Crossiella equi]|uniref:Uncharacterized protein n=1 Tax=Crossiella equi TaxID=130796 RepID=A0ABS5ASF8_9PSEU|nr:hypothetical protein [Crossiella equi]MBP2479491.1 hypothetical protein [Crossiella equi]